MSRKTLPSPKPPDSTVELESLDRIWAKLEEDIPVYEEPKPSDVSKRMIAEKYGISLQAADDRMNKLVATGKWKFVKVKLGYGDRPHKVLREIK